MGRAGPAHFFGWHQDDAVGAGNAATFIEDHRGSSCTLQIVDSDYAEDLPDYEDVGETYEQYRARKDQQP